MKILLINNEFPPIGGGGSILNYEIATQLVKMGYKITLITSSYRGMPNHEWVNNFQVIRVPAFRSSKSYSTIFELITFFISALFYSLYYTFRFKPDVIQAFFVVPSGGIAYLLNKIHKIPYLVYLGGSDVPWGNKVRFLHLYPLISPLIKLFWRSSNYIIAPSKGIISLVKHTDPQVVNKIKKIVNGVDIHKFPKRIKHNKTVHILAVGRLTYRKGFQDLIKALAVLKSERISFRCHIVGGGDYESELKILATKLKLNKLIKFLSTLNYSDLIKQYQKSDIFVLPSYSEGMSLALIEAMAAQNAVIATNVEGNNEVVRHNKNGYLIKVGDPSQMAKYLKDLIINRQKLRFLQENAYITSLKYDWQKLAKQYAQLYQSLAKK